MATSEVQICNLALAKLGARFINSLAEESREARYCNAFYPEVRDAVLREHPWNFAEKETALVEDPANPPVVKYATAYHLPTDCLHARHLENTATEFTVTGRKLHTNQPNAKLAYTARITDPAEFDASFTLALSARLAAELAEPVTKTSTKAQQMWTLYLNAVQAARTADAAEGVADPDTDDTWLSAAGFGGATLTTTES